jgi:hypothetical protein
MRAFNDGSYGWRRFHGHGSSPASLTPAGSLSWMKKMAPSRVLFPQKHVASSEEKKRKHEVSSLPLLVNRMDHMLGQTHPTFSYTIHTPNLSN